MKKEKFVYNKLMKNKYLFWITGLPGSGKTTIAKKIHRKIEKKYGPTIEISGDELRKNFLFNKYDIKNREEYAKFYSKFCKVLIKKNINVIFSTVSLFHRVQNWNRKHIDGYFEIFIKSDVKKIIKLGKKKIYKNKKNLVGVSLNAEFPKKPDLKIFNSFDKNTKELSDWLLKQIFKKLK